MEYLQISRALVLARCIFFSLASCLASQALADVSGTAIVVGGDTLSSAGMKVRLNGINTPKKDQTGKANGLSPPTVRFQTFKRSSKGLLECGGSVLGQIDGITEINEESTRTAETITKIAKSLGHVNLC